MKYIYLLSCVAFLSACTSQPEPDHPATVDSIIGKAQRDFDSGRREQALAYVDAAYTGLVAGPGDLFQKYKFKKECFQNIAIHQEHQKEQYVKALLFADSMLLVLRGFNADSRYGAMLAEANFTVGGLLFDMGSYEQSYRYCYAGKQIAEKLSDSCAQSGFFTRFALMRYRQEQYRDAVFFFRKAFTTSAACNLDFSTFISRQARIDDIGLCYDKSGMPDSAIIYYQRALAYIDSAGRRFPGKELFCRGAKGVVYGNLATALYNKGDTSGAEKLMKQSIEINRSGDEKMDAQVTQLKLTGLYLNAGRLPQAGALLEQSGRSLDTLPNVRARLTWLKLKAGYYTALQEPAMTGQWLQAYLRLKDSLDAEDKRLYRTDPVLGLEVLQNQDEMSILKKQNELHLFYLIATLGFAVMAIAIVFLLWHNWRNSKRHIAALTRLNKEVAGKNRVLQQTLTALEHSQQQNTRMLKVIAHDLRSPVGAIASLTEWFMEHDGEDQRDLLPLMHKTANSALGLISDLLHFNTSLDDLQKEAVELDNLVDYCVQMLQLKALEKGQQLLFQPACAVVDGDSEKLWRVFGNLIGNAIKFSPANTSIRIRMWQKSGNIVTCIQDEGIGIPDDLKGKIFNMSFAAKRKGTDGEASFGLGLSIARQIVNAHGGRIWFDSISGIGTSFYVQLPLLEPGASRGLARETNGGGMGQPAL